MPAATFGATDPSGGTITSIRINVFPTNATSITINGTTYTSGTFPALGVPVSTNAAGQPTQTITIDPVDGAVTSVITYFATDNAGKESATSGTASIPFTTVTVSGNVFNDVNGLTNSLVDGTGTNAGGVNAILVDGSGNVVATTAVAADGTYSFSGINGGAYTVRISTTAGTVGASAPAVALPSGWVSTGEGTAAAGDGTVNGITAITVTTANVTGVNFGIEQTPVASALSAASQVNPGGTTGAAVPAATFAGIEFSGGIISSLLISTFPTNATSITINGTTYTSGTFLSGGVSVPTNTTGQPTQTISIDPIDGAVTSVITYFLTDNAGKQSAASGIASMPFTTVSVSGNVFNDVNGLTNSLVDGSGTNAGGLNAILVDGSGNVVATAAVAADGTYSFSGINGGAYTVRISTSAGTIGSPAPAVALPSGWVSTGEGTAAAGDGTVNGITAITVTTANITGVNFGIEQTAVASTISAASQVNPGGVTSVTVPAATFGGTDFSGGTISSLLISAFPTNATSITINGTTYTSGTFLGGGVSVPTNTSGQPTQTITVDPVDGATTVAIPYYVIDNAGKQSATTGTANLPFTITVSGNVLNDVNGLTNLLIDGTGTNAGGLNAVLVDAGGNVAFTTPVAADGSYSFNVTPGGTYSVLISTLAGTVGLPAPAVSLPAGWVSTGEGTTIIGDGTPNGITNTFTVSVLNITGVNFGIEQPPVASTISAASQASPNGTTSITVPAATFGGTEFSGGTISSMLISAFPTNATSITINGTTYTSGTFPGAGVSVPTNATGQPTQTISVDPVDGAVIVAIPYYLTDNAGKQSLTTGTANMPFTITLSGTIVNDVDGLSNGVIDGTGGNAGGLNIILINSSGNVAFTAPVAADGTYSLNVTPGGIYTVLLSTSPGIIGSPAPAPSLPSGWVSTGEGTAAGGDGTPNSITSITVSNANITGANFGIEQAPVASTISATSQVNPGGTTNVTVPTVTFGGTDFGGGTISSLLISTFPTNATSITINGTTYISVTFPGGGVSVPTNATGQPTQTITVDPIDGAVTSVITYFVTDNAGKQSLTSGTANVPFTTVSVSGNVFNDVNGLTNSLVDGTGTNAGGLNVILVDVSGTVVATAAVSADGTYNIAGVSGGTYTVEITTATGTIGSPVPAVILPSGWVSTGEGTTTAGDGTVNGITNSFTVTNANVTSVNFGIEQPPVASTISATSQVNPGGTTSVTVPAATFGATEFAGGTVVSILINAFPTNATSITINGITYTSGTFPGGGVSVPTNAAGQPTQTITVDPTDGAVTVAISYFATDNAGKQSATTGTANIPFTTVSVSGNVFNDVNGLTNSLVDGTGTDAGGLNAILVDGSGNVVATTAVAVGGTYSFAGVNGGTYTVRISTTAGTVGNPAPAVVLPSGWVSTGEGTTAAGDGTPNGITNTFTVTNANVTGVNFGIEQTPTASTLSATSQTNPGGTTNVTVPAATFGATDPAGGTIISIRISAFPTNATSITINGTTYTSGTFPGAGVTVPTNATGQPTQIITIDPIDGAVTSVITYFATDNAGKESATRGTASMPFTTVSVNGNVFNDVNGLTNSLVDGTGTNAGGLNAILIDNAGNVAATAIVAAGGTYTFPSVNGGTYTVEITTAAGTIGSPAPVVTLPSGWVNTGEGTTAAGDGTVNGITAITVTTANVTGVNFGIEQTPTASTLSATSQTNPGGTTNVTVPAATFGATDPSSGTITSIRISAFPINATSITINGTTYTSGTFPGAGVTVPTNATGQPAQTITIDPIDGAVTSVITYFATDNADKESAASGTASMPFTTVSVSGNVFNDVNGLTNSLVDGTGTNAGGLNAILIDNAGNVAATAIVAAGGTYSFPSVNGGTYTVEITTATGTIGSPAPAVTLPSGWVNTGEGTTAAGDGTPNGITNSFTVTNANVTGVNFGIEQPPVPSALSAASQVNPGGTTSVTVPAATFAGTEFAGGTISSLLISSFPTNATSITINGTTYTSGTFPGGGVSVLTNAAGQPTQTIAIDPIDGEVISVITYFLTDNAGMQSTTSGTASIPFFCAIPGLWTGAVSSDWNNPANWCSNAVPISTTDVVIPTGAPNMPSTSSPVVINNLSIQPGTTLDISGDSFTINGTVSGTGTFSTNSTAALTITGSAGGSAGTLYFTNGSNNIGSLSVNESGAGGSVSIGSPLNIITILTVTNGTLNTNGNITLVSNATGTASVAAIDCNVATVNGNVTVERYLSARRAWRLLGVPVAGSQTIRNAWQEGTTHVSQNPFPGYGTHITGGTAANGFDSTQTNNPSIRIFNQALLSFIATPVTTTNQPLNNYPGYFLFVRGDRSTDLTTNTPLATPTVLRTKGPLNTCTQTYSTLQGFCQLVSNPYASAIDFTKLSRTNIPNRFFLWDPYLNSVGGYQTFDSTNNWVPTPGGGSYGSASNKIIQSGQAFFIQGTIGAGALIVNEDAKVAGSNNLVFRPMASLQKLAVTLSTVNANATTTINDGTLAIFDNSFAAAADNDDARKLTNVDEIFGLIRQDKLLSIEKRPVVSANDTLFIKAYRLKVKNYQLQIQPTNFDAAVMAYLEDSFLHTVTSIDMVAGTTVNFTVTADVASSSSDRFRIVFKPAVVLPVRFTNVKASEVENNIQVSWMVAEATDVVKYEIEKSADGQQFTTASTVFSSANNTGTASLNWLDVHPAAGYNYYRIKVTENNGNIYYSTIVFVKIKQPEPVLTVYPNPVISNNFYCQINSLPKGKYVLKLYNPLGQLIFTSEINHDGGKLLKTVNSGTILSKGAYHLMITDKEITLSKTINHN